VKKAPEEEFVNLVKQTYRVLLTRGMKGCYVFLEDATTKEYFVNHAKNKSGERLTSWSLDDRSLGSSHSSVSTSSVARGSNVLPTLLSAGVLTLRHCTVSFRLSVGGEGNELVPLHILELHHGVTFLRPCT
jgi:hypothetical protein